FGAGLSLLSFTFSSRVSCSCFSSISTLVASSRAILSQSLSLYLELGYNLTLFMPNTYSPFLFESLFVFFRFTVDQLEQREMLKMKDVLQTRTFCNRTRGKNLQISLVECFAYHMSSDVKEI